MILLSAGKDSRFLSLSYKIFLHQLYRVFLEKHEAQSSFDKILVSVRAWSLTAHILSVCVFSATLICCSYYDIRYYSDRLNFIFPNCRPYSISVVKVMMRCQRWTRELNRNNVCPFRYYWNVHLVFARAINKERKLHTHTQVI